MGTKAALAIDAASIDSLVTLIDCMEQTPRLSDNEVRALYEPYSESLFERMISTGQRLGEVRGGTLSFLAEVDDRSDVIARDQDFDWQLGVVSGTFSEFLQTGEVPPPHYAMRVAILLRKAARQDLERQFLQGWEKHFGGRGVGSTYSKLSQRLAKINERIGR